MSCLCLLSDGQPCTSPSQGRNFSRLTGVPYSIVQRATSDAVRYGNMVCEPLPGDEEFETYIDDSEYEKYPENQLLLRGNGTCSSDPLTPETDRIDESRQNIVHAVRIKDYPILTNRRICTIERLGESSKVYDYLLRLQ